MFFRKKEQTQANVFDDKWNSIIHRRFEIMRNIDKLYEEIQSSLNVLSCFENSHPNWEEENKHIKELRYKMLCECGGYDGTKVELNDLWNNHKDELQPHHCLDFRSLTEYPLRDCNCYLRDIARNYFKYRR